MADLNRALSITNPQTRGVIKRTKKACLNCRRKKARCSGERPRCNFCTRLSQHCSYEDKATPYTKLPKTRDSSGSTSGIHTDHPHNQLATKVAALESKLANLTSSLNTFPAGVDPGTSTTFLEPALSSSEFSDRLINSYESVPNNDSLILRDLPLHIQESLADTYFSFCHNQPYSFFHEADFRRRLTNGMIPDHLVLAFAATALRFSTDEYFAGRQTEAGEACAAKAWKSLVLTWMAVDESPRLDILQTITLLSIIDFTGGKLHPSWMKIGLSVRIAQDLGLMLEPSSDLSVADQEEHRRVFWSIYLLDKLTSVGRARPPVILDEDCQVSLPSDTDTFLKGPPSQPMQTIQQLQYGEPSDLHHPGHFAVLLITSSVLNRCVRYMLRNNRATREEPPWDSRSPFALINSRLLDLESRFDLAAPISTELSLKCTVNGAIDRQRSGRLLFSHALFRLSHCMLHHPFLLHTRLRTCITPKAPSSFRTLIFQNSLRDAQAITTLFQDAKEAGCNVVASFYGYCLTIAGSVQALYTAHEDESVRVGAVESLGFTMERLEDMSCHWKHASHMLPRLKSFSENAHDYAQLLNPDAKPTFTKAELESLWCLVDYTAMSKKVINTESADQVQAPAWFDLDFGGANSDEMQPPPDAISRDVIMSLFDEPYLYGTPQLIGSESSTW